MASKPDSGVLLSSTRQLTPEKGQATSPATKDDPVLRYRKTPVFLLAIYLPTLIVPWVLICIMTKRPLGGPSYYDQSGAHSTDNLAGVVIAQLFKSINAVLVVPIISALLAHAAIVYATRRRHDQKLNVQQVFALADKGWSNYLLLWSARSRGKSSLFLWLGALLVFLGAILQPLISVLVTFEEIAATSCLDIPVNGCSKYGPMVVGYDPEPADMPIVQRDLVLQDVLGHLVTVSDIEPQPNLWPIIKPGSSSSIAGYLTPPNRRIFESYADRIGLYPDGFFVTALDNGTNTGVLREHAIRLNSSVHCEHISDSDFPSPCPGGRPLEIHIERRGLTLGVCAPGNASQFPFTPSRHRQDIAEELYIRKEEPYSLAQVRSNFTVRCTASTSRGYFELGNEKNNYVYGPLLDRWPDPDDIATNFNDYRSLEADYARPTEEDPSTSQLSYMLPEQQWIGSPFEDGIDETASTPGPLMVSAEVLFGNYSFLQFITDNTTALTSKQAFAAVCEHGSIPFSQVATFDTIGERPSLYCFDIPHQLSGGHDDDWYDEDLVSVVTSHARIFNDTDVAEYALTMSMYFANRAVLTKTVLGQNPVGQREIYASPGTTTTRPTMATASLVVITVLMFLQVLGLIILAWFIYSMPTWAAAFDAMEVARIGKALPDSDLPPLGPVTLEDEMRLTKVDGLIGRNDLANVESKVGDGNAEMPSGRVQLALGGQGLISRKL
ncbi:hypothetical protein Hte_005663 [Hypoxylon texense]